MLHTASGLPAKFLVGIGLLLAASHIFAQSSQSGGIIGVVKDASGAMIVGAAVTVSNLETGITERRIFTNTEGSYTAASLRPGSYRLEIIEKGFNKYVATLAVRINETVRHDVTLEVGTLLQGVSVHAAGTLINTQNPTTGEPISNQTLTALPLAEPNFLFLLGLSPGTSMEPADVRKSGRATVDVSVNGQRTTNNSVTLEGISIVDFNLAHFDYLPIPNPETIQEFKVATSLYDASLGGKGGGALALVLKSGTQYLHWTLYGSMRNDAFNANEWFRAHLNQPRAKLIQNVVGGQASGPLPFLKGFWFSNVQVIRGRNGVDTNGSSINPTITALPMNPDGTTSAALLANQFGLSPSQIDPVALNILNFKSSYYGGTYLIPRPGQAGCSNDIVAPTRRGFPGTFTCNFSKVSSPYDTQFTISYDQPLRDSRDSLRLRTFYDNSGADKPFGTDASLSGPRDDTLENRFLSISYTTQISNRQINEARFGMNRSVFVQAPGDILTLKDVGATRSNESSYPGIYAFSPGTFSFGVGSNDERGTASNNFQWGDSWSLSIGKHNLHAGGDLLRYQLNRYNNGGSRGTMDLFPLGTSQPTRWLNFITGTVPWTAVAVGDSERYFRAFSADLYFEDDYRWTSRLTVSLGLRWEAMQFAHDTLYRDQEYVSGRAQQGLNPFVFPASLNLSGFTGTPGVQDCALRHCWDTNNFAPRLGFAWDIFGDGRTVFRGGYGIYHQQLSNQAILQGTGGAPFRARVIRLTTTPSPLQLANPFPNLGPGGTKLLPQYVPVRSVFSGVSGDVNDPGATVNWENTAGELCQTSGGSALNCSIDLANYTTADQNLHAPYTQQWNLTLQRELGRDWVLEIGYVGSHGVGGIVIWSPAQSRLASPSSPITVSDASGKSYSITTNNLANLTLRSSTLGLTMLNSASQTSNLGNQIYQSAQVVLSHSFEGGLFFQASYTFGKNIDDVSGSVNIDELFGLGTTGRGGAWLYNDLTDVRANRAISDLDRRHRLSISYVYQFPVPRNGFFSTQLFQGWRISGLLTLQSGQPFTISDLVGGAYGFNLGPPAAVCSNEPITAPAGDAPLAVCIPGAPTNPLAARTSGPIEQRLDYYINPNLFSHPLPVPSAGDTDSTAFGSPGMRNIYRGPFQQSVDFSIMKDFRIAERHAVLFRVDFFNIFNHPVFSIPAYSDFSGDPANFSRITQTVIPARLIQFGLKYSF